MNAGLRDLVYIALFAAVTAVLGLAPKIDVGPVPISAQSMGPMLAGAILGARAGASSQAVFLALVAAGLPLLSGGRGGLGVFGTPSVGYLIAFPIAAFVIGALVERVWSRLTFPTAFAITLLGGVGVIHLLGVIGWALTLYLGGATTFAAAVTAAVIGDLVFLPGDMAKAFLAASAAMFVKRGYPLIGR
ncbi:MAG: biotin transporter BioY [Hyphomicrobiales bacterium]|nr:biotin transporter BioY [Hyphomicrobiales bacterium]